MYALLDCSHTQNHERSKAVAQEGSIDDYPASHTHARVVEGWPRNSSHQPRRLETPFPRLGGETMYITARPYCTGTHDAARGSPRLIIPPASAVCGSLCASRCVHPSSVHFILRVLLDCLTVFIISGRVGGLLLYPIASRLLLAWCVAFLDWKTAGSKKAGARAVVISVAASRGGRRPLTASESRAARATGKRRASARTTT